MSRHFLWCRRYLHIGSSVLKDISYGNAYPPRLIHTLIGDRRGFHLYGLSGFLEFDWILPEDLVKRCFSRI